MQSIQLLTTNQAAKTLQISVATMNVWRMKGLGPEYIKVGRQVRYTDQSLIEFCNENTKRHTGE